jgi:hypothetical protein
MKIKELEKRLNELENRSGQIVLSITPEEAAGLDEWETAIPHKPRPLLRCSYNPGIAEAVTTGAAATPEA